MVLYNLIYFHIAPKNVMPKIRKALIMGKDIIKRPS